MPELESIITSDGSTSLYNSELDETYHSRHGALQEAEHVFIETGLSHFVGLFEPSSLSIFEMGLGTGLNCLLTALWAKKNKVSVNYIGIEKVVLNNQQIASCNYSDLLKNEDSKTYFDSIHSSTWDMQTQIHAYFTLLKLEAEIETISISSEIDVVFYDAFGPRVQPHLWEKPILNILFNMLKPNGVLVTYCAKGSVRRNLQELGFEVERLPGPPGKREMLRGTKLV